jgi:hypothetical protein
VVVDRYEELQIGSRRQRVDFSCCVFELERTLGLGKSCWETGRLKLCELYGQLRGGVSQGKVPVLTWDEGLHNEGGSKEGIQTFSRAARE